MFSVELKHTLEKNRLYQSLEPHELDLLIAHSKIVSFSSGELIIKQGRHSDGIYLILEGMTTIAGQIVGEGVTHLASLAPGRIFGASSLIIKGPHATSMIADTPVKCLFIPKKYLEMLSLFYPGTKYKIMRELADNVSERIKTLTEKVSEIMLNTEMIKRSLFGEVIKSLTHPSPITLQETEMDLQEWQAVFSASAIDDLFSQGDLIKTVNQCTLIQEGEENASCYFVLKGAVQSSLIKKNKVAKISILGPLSFFCPLSFIDENSSQSLVNYTTCERAILLKFDKTLLDELQLKNSKLWYKIFDVIVESFFFLSQFLEKLDMRINSENYNR